MEKLKMHSPNLTDENIAKIRELFPGCVTEATDEDGKLRYAVDFDQLRQELSDHIVEGPQERYRLDWPGKRKALFLANAPIAKSLRPLRKHSIEFDTARNLFIEGDNLDALKLLQEAYIGKIKMIFIDPPYNTGHDFVYKDDFSTSASEYLKSTGEISENGTRLTANQKSNGRFHSDWLSFLYPRLKLARNFLKDDGVIFIAIDDNEHANLRSLCDEVFGQENFIANIVWQHSVQPKGYTGVFSQHHNHILMYQKSDNFDLHSLDRTEEDNKAYSNPDNDPRGDWRSGDVRNALFRPNLRYDLKTPSGKSIPPPENGWRWSKETMAQKIATGEVVFKDNETKIIRKIYLDTLEGRTPETIWFGKDAGTTRDGARELKEIFEGEAPFDTVKPTALIKRMIKISGAKKDDFVLDFFGGSGSTGVACLDDDYPNFILVQLDEPTDTNKPHGKIASKQGLNTISVLALERLRRTLAKAEKNGGAKKGVRFLRVDTSNMRSTFYQPSQTDQSSLLDAVENVKSDRTDPEDLLFQVLVDWGVDLTLPITRQDVQGKAVFFVNEKPYDLIACFDYGLTEELVKELAKHEPARVVFRDNGFASDAIKINVEQIFKQLSPATDVKSI
ncbi:site-specific DNA-methyltransferase [Oceanicaulis alexandrii]|uniref:site-specific DNA-methyltransferase n=1 Tax=Oceanicaulis alexandrii TaxID=153233 RepID=UPI003B5027D9